MLSDPTEAAHRARAPRGSGTLLAGTPENMLRWLTAGESHGPSLVAILEGLPAHVRVTSDDIREALARRRLGLRTRRPDEVRAGRGDARRRRPPR